MSSITETQLYRILYLATARTYLEALIKATPGKGIVASEWDLSVGPNGVVLFNEEYGSIVKYLEEGTAPHIIKPKTSKALAFGWKNSPIPSPNANGEFIFAQVRHPGFEARRFVQKVMEDPKLFSEWESLVTAELEKLISFK